MFFQISPVYKKPKVKLLQKKVEDEAQIETLSLAPFTANPKIVFENVTVGTVHSRKLLILNPTANNIYLTVIQKMEEDLHLNFDWVQAEVKAGEQKLLEMVWCPGMEVRCRQMFTLSDGKKIHRDVAVILKSTAPKKARVAEKRKSAASTVPLVRKPISIAKKLKPSSPRRYSPPKPHRPSSPLLDDGRGRHTLGQKGCDAKNISSNVPCLTANKENLSPATNNSSYFVSPTNLTFGMDGTKIDPRRATYVVNHAPIDARYMYTVNASPNFDDSLESPGPPPLRELGNTFDLKKYSPGFEYKLHVEESFTFSPANFQPSVTSSTSKPSSREASAEAERLGFYLNFSGGSSNTYTKCDVSGGTYVKDDSSFDKSPVTSRREPSPPTLLRSRAFDFADVGVTEFRKQQLSSIAEEQPTGCHGGGAKRKSPRFYHAVCPKRPHVAQRPVQEWSRQQQAACRTARKSGGLNLKRFNADGSTSAPLTVVSETKISSVMVHNPFLYAHILDPFMTAHVYCTDEWLERQQENFRKWLNVLLTPPEELLAQTDEIDVAKIWQDCKKAESIADAPSRESLSLSAHHSNSKLDALRKQARAVFKSERVCSALYKVCLAVDSDKLSIRDDKDIHLNLRLKADVTALILSYNPLWLRLGLETIYDEVLPLRSNSDTAGLLRFLMERFFRNPQLVKKHKTVYSPKYARDLKRFALKKFLTLVYLLDACKMQKLIQHDPCLFRKNAQDKESRLVLIRFARETLSAVGDITKYLKSLGYVVHHVQSYIHEFEYGVKTLSGDLRDGVRLARVMEIIQLRDDLTSKLRVPAISRLQKVHNTQVVFDALKESGYDVQHDITPKDIVDGHREKTLSFLWQIIYKYEAPLMHKSATTVQRWFRSLPIALKRSRLRRIRLRREEAARTIQRWYTRLKRARVYERFSVIARVVIRLQAIGRGWLARLDYRHRIDAAVTLQKNYRMWVARKHYVTLRNACVTIQRTYRASKLASSQRLAYLRLRGAVIAVQRRWRAKRLGDAQRRAYLKLKGSAAAVQRRFRALIEMKTQRNSYVELKQSVVKIQRWYRSVLVMRTCRNRYLALKLSVSVVETKYAALRSMRVQRAEYLTMKTSAVVIQRWFRGVTQTRTLRIQFQTTRLAVVMIQHRYRANLAMRNERDAYRRFRKAALTIQSRFRAVKARKEFLKLKWAAVVTQQRYRAKVEMGVQQKWFCRLKRAALVIQRGYRARLAMQNDLEYYTTLRKAVITIQSRFRSVKARKEFLKLKWAAVVIQRRYRAKMEMEVQQKWFCRVKWAALAIQRRYRARLAMQKDLEYYTTLKKAVVTIQSRFRAAKARKEFLKLKWAAVVIQRRYRAKMEMEVQQNWFCRAKWAALVIQRRYRARSAMQKDLEYYTVLRKAVVTIQTRFRASKARKEFWKLKWAAVVIQQRYRAKVTMERQQNLFCRLKWATLVVQRRYRARLAMQKDLEYYTTFREAVVTIQSRFRAAKARKEFLKLKWAAVVIQLRYRAKMEMEAQQKWFCRVKWASLVIQRRYRARLAMQKDLEYYTTLKKAVVTIQSRFRAAKARKEFLKLKWAAVVIQRRYRAKMEMEVQQNWFCRAKWAALVIQRRYRARLAMQKDLEYYTTFRKAVVTIQSTFRAVKAKKEFLKLKWAAVVIQQRYRAKVAMEVQEKLFCRLKWATLVVQRRYRARLAMQNDLEYYTALRNSVVTIQSRFRAAKDRKEFLKLKWAAVVVQRRYRAKVAMEEQQNWYCRVRWAALVIQRRFRAWKTMKIERVKYVELRRATLSIQRYCRGYLVRKKYEPLLTPEAVEARRAEKLRNAAAVRIQAAWKGYAQRNSNVAEMGAIRRWKKLAATKLAMPGANKTLAERCETAMMCITNEHATLLQIIKALEDIDFVTRHSRDSCLRMSLILPDQLCIIISSAARSLPEMNACNLAAYILINFYKYPKTRPSSWVPQYIDQIVNVLMHSCDKDEPLFTTLCTLLWLFAHERKWKKFIMNLPNIQSRLSKIEALVQRKQNMTAKKKNLGSHSYFGYLKNPVLPTCTANWGLDYERPNTFTNSVYAIENLLNILNS
ncbi:protein abnormal spindle isoform X2 [Cylas formicarius]|uniref:protein abnormal spindle isoform X2 n=1 Tax=Cylas formicarius TaxID=197179 RepID=UPI0029589696|nr:protein abnormal spindle isoform X2 [Cylas formicarius]